MTTTEQSMETQIAVAIEQIGGVRKDINALSEKIDNNYVTKSEFEPVQKIVYGLVGMMLVTVVSALLLLVVKQ